MEQKGDLEIVATQGKMWVHLNFVLVDLNKKVRRTSATKAKKVSLEPCSKGHLR